MTHQRVPGISPRTASRSQQTPIKQPRSSIKLRSARQRFAKVKPSHAPATAGPAYGQLDQNAAML
jgi:hypothetical protein